MDLLNALTLMAEILGIREGLLLCIRMNLTKCMIVRDSQIAFQVISHLLIFGALSLL